MDKTEDLKTVKAEELRNKLDKTSPDNESFKEGVALVNVLSPEHYNAKHIPGSINIPKGREKRFEELFDREKEIVVYCASPQCSASPNVAKTLHARGFKNIIDFEGGVSEWENRGYPLASGEGA